MNKSASAAPVWVPVPGSGLLQPAASGVPLFWEPGRPPRAPHTRKSLLRMGRKVNPIDSSPSKIYHHPQKKQNPAEPGRRLL
jgi:hypothetical protein